jgi:TRAP-type C4-dicarboxylate transport system permease small subunit
MEKAFEVYQRITDVLFKVILSLAALIVGLDVLSIFLEAVGRYVVGSSRAFMEELPRLMVPFVVFPMMGALLKVKKHISVDILPDRLTGKARSLLMITVYSVVVAVAIQFLIAGILAVKYYHEMGFETHTEIIFKLWVTYLPFPIGFGLLILFALEMLWRELVTLIKLCRSSQHEGEGGETS